jgi:gas vesicle protein
MKSTSKIAIISVIAGAAIGAALGILFAPDKGSVTRKKLKDKAEDLGDNLSDKYNVLKDEYKTLRDKMKSNHRHPAEVHPE